MMIKIILGILLFAFILIQFIPYGFPPTSSSNDNDLIVTARVSEDVAEILRNSCYDCHSNETRYPWYSHVMPAKWLIVKDVNEGREELNFSNWGIMEKRRQIKVLDELVDEVKDGDMPLPVYTLLHRGAKLSDEQKQILADWTDKLSGEILGE